MIRCSATKPSTVANKLAPGVFEATGKLVVVIDDEPPATLSTGCKGRVTRASTAWFGTWIVRAPPVPADGVAAVEDVAEEERSGFRRATTRS